MMISDDGSKLAFNKRELAVLTSMMAPAERPSLAALWFHGGQAKAWATDGFRAVMVEREIKPPRGNPKAPSVAIPAETAHHLAKSLGSRDLVVVDISGAKVTLDVRAPFDRGAEIEAFAEIETRTRSKHVASCTRHTGGFRAIDFVFPKHHERGSKGAAVAFNASLIAPLIALAKVAEPEGEVWINLGPPLDPILFAARAEPFTVWRVVVMPRRGDGWPEIKPIAAAEPAAAGEPAAAEPAATEPAPNQGELAPRTEPAAAAEPAAAKPAAAAEPAKPKARGRGRGRAKLRAAS